MRVIIVDDEPLARKGLELALQKYAQVEIIAQCENGLEALKVIRQMQPDVVFLDIQMPKLSGFEVIELLDDPKPMIIFVTAYDEYALRAFEAQAIDYLLKPVNPERLEKTLQRVGHFLNSQKKQNFQKLLSEQRKTAEPLKRILVREGSDIHIIPVADVLYIQAEDDYISIHTKDDTFLKYERLSRLKELLDPTLFVRIHRSFILNLHYLQRIEAYGKDSHVAKLQNGQTLPISRSGYLRLKQLFIE